MWISISQHAIVSEMLEEAITRKQSLVETTENLIAALRSKVVEIQLPRAYLKQLTLNMMPGEDDQGKFTLMRDGMFYELGIHYPEFRFSVSEDLQPDCFRFMINALPTLPRRGLDPNQCLINEMPEFLRLLNIEVQPAVNPFRGNTGAITDVKNMPVARKSHLTTWNQLGYIVLALSVELRAHAHCFLDCTVVEGLLGRLGTYFPQLIKTVQKRYSLFFITQTLRLLLTEEISIRDLPHILQAMVDFDYIVTDESQYIIFDLRLPSYRQPGKDWLNDLVNLASFVRITMKRYISHKYTRGRNTLRVCLLEPKIEQLLANRQSLPPEVHQAQLGEHQKSSIIAAVRSELEKLSSSVDIPVILTTTNVRPVIRALIAPLFPRLPVVAYQELSPEMNIQPVARITLNS